MAAARPILFIGPRESTASRVVDRYSCGWQIDCGDKQGVINLLLRVADRRELVQQAGENGHRAFLQEYDRPIGTGRVAAVIGVPARDNVLFATSALEHIELLPASSNATSHTFQEHANGNGDTPPRIPVGQAEVSTKVYRSGSDA
jgi:hypothetical protein